MKKLAYIFTVLAVVGIAILSSCRRDNGATGVVSEITVDATLYTSDAQGVQSKINAAAFDDGDLISFYGVKYDGGVAQDLGANSNTYISNQLFKRDNGLFKSFDGTNFNRQFFPNNGSPVDLYALYPYNAVAPSSYTAYVFDVKTNQSKSDKSDYYVSDLMMSKRVNIAPTAVPSKMVFNHLMSRIVVNAKATNYPNGAKVVSMRFLDIDTRATVDLRAYNPATSVAGSVVSTSQVDSLRPFSETRIVAGYDTTFVAIVPPQKWAKDKVVMEIVLSDKSKQTYKMASECVLESGKEAVFSLVVNFGEQYAINAGPVTIGPWGTLEFTGSAEQASDDKFKMTFVNKNIDLTTVAKVKVGVNGNRTFTLPRKALGDASSELYFDFRGVGNRPNEYPFNITGFEMLTSGDVSLGGRFTLPTPIEIIAPALTNLEYDMSARTIVKK